MTPSCLTKDTAPSGCACSADAEKNRAPRAKAKRFMLGEDIFLDSTPDRKSQAGIRFRGHLATAFQTIGIVKEPFRGPGADSRKGHAPVARWRSSRRAPRRVRDRLFQMSHAFRDWP